MKELQDRYNIDLPTKDYTWYKNCTLLINTLESIELIESTLIIYPNNCIERNAFILLNLQFIGAAQERVNYSFTRKYQKLKDFSFTETVKKTNKSWFGHDRYAIAHSLNLNFLTIFDDSKQKVLEDLIALKQIIMEILKQNHKPSSQIPLFTKKLDFEPLIQDVINNIVIKNLSNNKYLNNIANILSVLQDCLSPQDKEIFFISPARQALMIFLVQAIGNSVKLYYKNSKDQISSNMNDLIEKRNRIAYTILFRNAINSTHQEWNYLQKPFGDNGIFFEEIKNILKIKLKNIDIVSPSTKNTVSEIVVQNETTLPID